MRQLFGVVLLSLSLLANAGANETAEARKLLDKVITALGGEKVLSRGPGLTGKSTGTVTVNEQSATIRNEWSVQGYDRLRWSSEITLNDSHHTSLLVMNGAKAWVSLNGQATMPFPEQFREMLRTDFLMLRLLEDPLPLRDKEYKLSPLGELNINGKTAVGLKVSHKDRPDVDVFFDKETHLPVRAEYRLKETPDGEEVTHTIYLGAYKKIAGRQFATNLKLQREDKIVLEMQRMEIQAVEKVDDVLFAEP